MSLVNGERGSQSATLISLPGKINVGFNTIHKMKFNTVLLAPDSGALGGSAAPAPAAPAAAAPAKANAPAKVAKTKPDGTRIYTPRGKTVLARRIVLTKDGKVAGVGRPGKDESGRLVVFVPQGMKYSPEIHGKGVRYGGKDVHPPLKRLVIEKLGYALPKSVKVAKVKGFAPAKAAKKSAPKKAAKKASVKKTVTVPVTPAPAPEVAPVAAPVSAVPETAPVTA